VDHRVLSGVIGVHINRGNREATDALLPQFEQLALSSDGVAAVTGLTTLGLNAFWRGMHTAAHDYLTPACRAYRGEEFQRYARDYGYDGGIFSYAYFSWNLWALGRPAQALAAHRELMMLAESSFDPFSLPLALAFGVALAHNRREPDEMLAKAEQLSAVATEQKLYFWLTIGHFGRGGALTLRGQAAEGIGHVRLGLDLARAIGATTLYGYYLSFLAGAHLETGQVDEGLAVVEEALDLCQRAIARWHEPELLRLKGALLRRRGDDGAAEACLRQSLGIARAATARAWELRTATTLAVLLRDTGRPGEARPLLAEAYAGFAEGFELPDLQDAQKLLAQLP
jgi:adenylate cyclase